METYHTTPTPLSSFEPDVIIAGGGASGCVLAGRLAQALPTLQILVLEAGSNNLNDPTVVKPAVYPMHQHPSASRSKFYAGEPSEALNGRVPVIPVGNGLGGGSSVNFMMYTRASASDFDDWNMPGWSAEELVPLIRKLETYYVPGGGPTHGTDGPIAVSLGGHSEERVMQDMQDAVEELGYNVVDDANDLETVNAFQRWAKYIDPHTGHRQDTAHRYVHPIVEQGRGNLHILCDVQVVRVIISDGKAVGVEYVPASFTPFSEDPPPPSTIVEAKRLVVVAAGSLSTPCILERSGIGSPTVLSAAGVDTVVDLPGVGMELQDHNLISVPMQVTDNIDTHDAFLRGDEGERAKAEVEFEKGVGKLATNMVDFGGKIRPSEDELLEMDEEFGKVWNEFFKDKPDKPVAIIASMNSISNPAWLSLEDKNKYITMAAYTAYLFSRGSIHISSKNPYSAPTLRPGYMEHPADLATLVWVYKVVREISRRMKCVVREVKDLHPKFPEGSAATCQDYLEPGKAVGRLVYTSEDDKAIEEWIRSSVRTTWHPLGTCAMKDRAEGGVVDKKLMVHGVEKLMLADLSIPPGNVGANTYNTALLIGEKAATLAAEYLGLEL